MVEKSSTLMHYPCEITIRAMGLKTDDFETAVYSIVKRHCPAINQQNVMLRPSKNNKYLSINITITAESKAQMDGLYHELSASEHVIIAL